MRPSMKVSMPTIEQVPIAQLKGWPKNPRKRHAVDGIVRSIESFGYLNPIVVQKGTYKILAGHGRLQALQSRKVQTVPVIVADIDDKNAEAYAIADNKLNDSSQFDLRDVAQLLADMDSELRDLTGFSENEMQSLAALNAELDDAEMVAFAAHKNTQYAGEENTHQGNGALETVYREDRLDTVHLDHARQYHHRRIPSYDIGSSEWLARSLLHSEPR